MEKEYFAKKANFENEIAGIFVIHTQCYKEQVILLFFPFSCVEMTLRSLKYNKYHICSNTLIPALYRTCYISTIQISSTV